MTIWLPRLQNKLEIHKSGRHKFLKINKTYLRLKFFNFMINYIPDNERLD